MTTNLYGDNKFAPGTVSDSYVPDQLIAGPFPLETQPILVASGVLKRGTVLGSISNQGVFGAPGATNVGNGTIGAVSRGTGSLNGVYTLTATSPTAFSVTDPEGGALPPAAVGTAYSQSGIAFTITAGSTAFAVGDSFTVTTTDAVGQFITSVKTASDGSQTPRAILVDDVDASAGPARAGAYLTGDFNGRALTFDASWTLSQIRDALRASSIFVKASVSAAEPTS